jgi:hypothetical protein
MKQFVKALDKNGPCFQYLTQKFPLLSTAMFHPVLQVLQFKNIGVCRKFPDRAGISHD